MISNDPDNISFKKYYVSLQNKSRPLSRGEYNVYSTFQSHEPEFDYLKSLEIEEKINKIRWLPQQNAAHFLLSTNGKNTLFLGKKKKKPSCMSFEYYLIDDALVGFFWSVLGLFVSFLITQCLF